MERTIIGYYDDEGEPVMLPAKWEICGRCDGDGTTINPNIDGHGISTSDECWLDDDFRENYFGGVYDVACHQCNGTGKWLDIDIPNVDPAQLDAYYDWLEDEANSRQVEAMERRYGA